MRVLFVCVPQTGHVTPLLPLADAFAAQGDDVLFATGAEVASAVTGRGLGFEQVCPPLGDWFAALAARTRGAPGDGLRPESIERYFVPRLFCEIGAAAMIDDLLALGRRFTPDLILYDALAFAAPLAAALLDVRAVQHTLGPLLEPTVLDLARDAMSPMWREFGRDAPPYAGVYDGATLTICPPSLDPASGQLPGAQPLRPAELPRETARPASLPDEEAKHPLVYLTLGTFSNTNVELFRLVLRALADEPVNLMVTVGRDVDPAVLGRPPDNARVERFVPQAELLPHCAAVVHHAGAGTTFGVLAHGLPSLALPQSADNFVIAERLASAGAARVLLPGAANAESIRSGVRGVLAADGYRTRARQVAAEIAVMPSTQEVAALLLP
jgi:UDP:flavonoid glycosyltransferase YjiC (YdhE family)